jgi:hypothetical protein
MHLLTAIATFMHSTPPAVAAAAILFLAGCAYGPVPVVAVIDIDPTYSLGEFTSAAAGSLAAVVHGNPFGGDQASFAAAVTDAMRGQHFGPETKFVPTAPEVRPTYRVVLDFTGAVLSGTQLCQGAVPKAPQGAAARPGVVSLHAAFCRGARDLTEMQAGITGATDAAHPRFRWLVAATTRELFPLTIPDGDRDADFD